MKTELERTLAYLKSNKFRITSQRVAILEYLINTVTHPTAEEIYQELKGDHSGMSVATIYNTLNLLMEYGFVKEIRQGGSSARFDYYGKDDDHFHLICDRCGTINDYDFPILDTLSKNISKDTGFEIDELNLRIHGLCKDCQNELKENN